MKPLVILVLNVAAVAAAFVAYDVMRSEPPVTSAGPDTAAAQSAALELRVEMLEAERRRTRRPAGIDPNILERLSALERAAPTPVAAADPQLASAAPGEPAVTKNDQPSASAALDEPSPAEIKRFRRVMDAVRREDAIERNKYKIDATLDALPINLTEKQRTKVHAAFAAFQPRAREIWTEAKIQAQQTIEAGGQVDRATIVADTTAVIQQEFVETLSSIVSPADSQTIAASLLAGGK